LTLIIIFRKVAIHITWNKFNLSTISEYFLTQLCHSVKAYSMIGIIKRNFIHMYAKTLSYYVKLGPHIEYANSVWHPYKKEILKTLKGSEKSHKTCQRTEEVWLQKRLKNTPSFSKIQKSQR